MSRRENRNLLVPILVLGVLVSACSRADKVNPPDKVNAPKEGNTAMAIEISSDAFSKGEAIPAKYTCDGDDVSPALRWGNIPKDAKSLVVICEDPDAPSGNFVHWVLYGLPPSVDVLSEGVAKTETLPNGARQGRNGFGRIGYGGPCPPRNGAHRYFFRLYALDIEPRLGPGVDKSEIDRMMKDHVLASGDLMGTYKRK